MMNNEIAAQQERVHLITVVEALKPAAIATGFDWPTARPETSTNDELREFIEEVTSFIRMEVNGEI